MSLPTTALGQGLLGRPYALVGFEMAQPKDPVLRELGDWSHGINFSANLPVYEMLDIQINASHSSFGGEVYSSGPPVDIDISGNSFSVMAITHFMPDEVIDPFVGVGVGYQSIRFEASSGIQKKSVSDDTTGVDWVAGFEWKLNDQLALRPQLGSADDFDDFDVDDFFIDNLYYEVELIYWINEEFFAGMFVGSDFDDTEIAVGCFLGLGRW